MHDACFFHGCTKSIAIAFVAASLQHLTDTRSSRTPAASWPRDSLL